MMTEQDMEQARTAGNSPQRKKYSESVPTPRSVPGGPDFAKAARDGSGGDDLATYVARRVPTPRAEDSQCAGGHGDKDDTLYGMMCKPKRVPTPNTPNGGRAIPEDAEFNESGLSAYNADGKKVQVDLNQFLKRLPTITSQDASNNCGPSQMDRDALNVSVGGPLNPDWCEWLMGWPIGWSSLAPLPPERFAQWLASREWWHAEPAGIPRTARDVPNRVARLTAIGNGQVPDCVALAFEILSK